MIVIEEKEMSHKNDLSFIAKLNGKEKFSLRKLSVGLVTVALGTTFFLESSNTAHAAETLQIKMLLAKKVLPILSNRAL